MRRRAFIAGLGSAGAWQVVGFAQDRTRRIGVLMPFAESDPEAHARAVVFREALQKLGWTEGRNIRIDNRWALNAESSQRYARELIALQPDLIVAHTTPPAQAVQQETRSIPILFVGVADPVRSGLVASLPRPGGNVTGFTNLEPTMAGKWLELLKEIAPPLAQIAILFNPATAPYTEHFVQPFKAAAASLVTEAVVAPVRDSSELEATIAAQARAPNGVLS